jgi:hypothetical protein
MRSQSSGSLGMGTGALRALRCSSSSGLSARCATKAALKVGEQRRTYCGTMRSPWKIGSIGPRGKPPALQCTCTCCVEVAISPRSSTMRSRSMARTWPRRTTRRMRRSCASSASLRMAHRNIVGSTPVSMRCSRRAASSRSNNSDKEPASRAISSSFTIAARVGRANGAAGCTLARLSTQASRGRIQVMVSGSTSCPSSHRAVSMAVLPPPTMTTPAAGSRWRTSSVGVRQRMPSATAKRGPCVAGTWVSARVASTQRWRASSGRRSPFTSETATPCASTSCKGSQLTRPLASRRWCSTRW